MIEEQIHKTALSYITDFFNQSELNLQYYRYLDIFLVRIKSKDIFRNRPLNITFLQEDSQNFEKLQELINMTPEDTHAKIHLEIHLYTYVYY